MDRNCLPRCWQHSSEPVLIWRHPCWYMDSMQMLYTRQVVAPLTGMHACSLADLSQGLSVLLSRPSVLLALLQIFVQRLDRSANRVDIGLPGSRGRRLETRFQSRENRQTYLASSYIIYYR